MGTIITISLPQRGSWPGTVTSVSFQNDLFSSTLTPEWVYQKGFQRWSQARPLSGLTSPPSKVFNKKLNSVVIETSHGRRIRLLLALRANIFTYFAPFFPDQQKPDLCTRSLGPLFLSHGPWVLAEWRWPERYWKIGKLTLSSYGL